MASTQRNLRQMSNSLAGELDRLCDRDSGRIPVPYRAWCEQLYRQSRRDRQRVLEKDLAPHRPTFQVGNNQSQPSCRMIGLVIHRLQVARSRIGRMVYRY